MDKKTYMQKLEHTMKCYGYTPYEYFYQFGLKIRGYMKYEFEDWEMQCPFLTDEDYHKLIQRLKLCIIIQKIRKLISQFSHVITIIF